MNTKKLRVIVPLAIVAISGIAFATHTSLGTLSALGWQDISLICPLGALSAMIALKTVIPRAVVSLVLTIIAIIVLGRAFCAWVCPVPVFSKLRGILKKNEGAPSEKDVLNGSASAGANTGETELSAETCASIRTQAEALRCKDAASGQNAEACASCGKKRENDPSASRGIVLGGALLSAAIFGFPVFCLICPIGLTFALVFVLIMLFGNGDVTLSVVLIPVILLVEVVFFRKWCSHICPLSIMMSLIGKLNKTFKPAIDNSTCLESSRGIHCGKCAEACEVGIDPRHPENGADLSECAKCRACVDACPAHAISMPLILPSDSSKEAETKS